MIDLKNLNIILTGGTGVIGNAIIDKLISAGAHVIATGTNEEKLKIIQDKHKELDVMKFNLSDHGGIDKFVEDCSKNFSNKIDVLINNAGRSAGDDFENVTDNQWQEDLELKLFAAIRSSRIAIKYMKKQNSGRIINVTNLGGKAPGYSSVPTSVSRSAGIALTKALSKDSAKYNILVNTVCIGLIKSAQHEKRWIKDHENSNISLEEWYLELGKDVPLKRVGESSEAADVITFLASKRASYISGVAINIDGGLSPVV